MKTPYVYCIFRLDRKFYKRINSDLKCRGYKHVKAIVPTISVLKKSRKGNNEYEDVPLLFNYGFIKMKSEKAFDRLPKQTKERYPRHNVIHEVFGLQTQKKEVESR